MVIVVTVAALEAVLRLGQGHVAHLRVGVADNFKLNTKEGTRRLQQRAVELLLLLHHVACDRLIMARNSSSGAITLRAMLMCTD